VDYIVFRGLSDDDVEPEIIFVEVKTWKSAALSEREKRVRYEVISLNELVDETHRAVEEEMDKLANTSGRN